MKKSIAIGLLIPAAIAGAIGAKWWWTQGRFVETTDNAYVQADIVTVAPEIDGHVLEVLARDNQRVKAGDPLVRIDPRDFEAKLADAKAKVRTQAAAIGTNDAEARHQQTVIDQAQAQLSASDAERHRAQSQYDRYAKLVVDRAVGRQDFDDAQAALVKAQADWVRAEASLEAERAELEVVHSRRDEAEAGLQEAQAQQDLAANELQKTVIKAPFDGTVGNRGVRPGQYAKAGEELLSVVPDEVHVVANFKETQLPRMKPGQKVSITVDAYPGAAIEGTLDSFAPASGALFSVLPPENATGNFTKIVQRLPVRISVSGRDASLLKPGLSVEASIDTRGGGTVAVAAR